MGTHPEGSQEQRDYLSYLLRLWRDSDEGQPVWRASLRSSHTGERAGFRNLDELCEFLRRQTDTLSHADRSGEES